MSVYLGPKLCWSFSHPSRILSDSVQRAQTEVPYPFHGYYDSKLTYHNERQGKVPHL